MNLLSTAFDLVAIAALLAGLLIVLRGKLALNKPIQHILLWFLGILLISCLLAIFRRHTSVTLWSTDDLDLLLDLTEFLIPVFFLLFINAFTQASLSETIFKKNRDYQALLDNLPGVAYRSSGDQHARIEHISGNITDLLGISAEEFLGRRHPSLLDYMHPEDKQSILPSYLKAISDEKPFTLEFRLFNSAGETVWVVDRGQPIKRSDGKGFYIDGILLDSTRMISAEQALSQREERMQAQQHALLKLSEYSGSLESAVQQVTETTARTLGISRASVWLFNQDKTRLDCLDVYSLGPDSHDAEQTLTVTDYPGYFSFMELGDIIAVSSAQSNEKTRELAPAYLAPLNIQSMMDTPIKIDGEVRGIVCAEQQEETRHWTIDERNFLRAISNVVSLLLEISVNRQIESALREERDRAQSYLDTVNVIIISLDADGHVTLINNYGCQLLGYEASEILGQHWLKNFIPAREKKDLIRIFNESVVDPEKLMGTYENHVITKSGEELLIRWNNSYQRDEQGNVIRLLSAGEDITELARQRSEKERLQEEMQYVQKMHSIVQLTGGIAHDFNNMLTSIMGYADLAQISIKRGAEIESDRYLGAIRATSKKAGKLVSQLLDYSRENVLVKETLDINDIIGDSKRMLEAMVSSSIHVVDELQQDLPLVQANRAQIQQVLMNLCQNSREALKSNDASIWIRTSVTQLLGGLCDSCFQRFDGRFVCLEVADNGVGIDPEIRRNIFDPFTSSKELGEGTGLGLSATHGIVHMHGGHILVHSEPGDRTSFKIYLPIEAEKPDQPLLREPEARKPQEQSQKSVSSTESGGRKRVLLVDDDESVTRLLSNYLERNGIDSRVINNSESAWSEFAKDSQAFDIVITDQTMPNLSGLELARRIRAKRDDIPVILCSGNNEMVDEKAAAELGISRFLNKPLRLENLTSVISELTEPGN